MDVKAIVIPNVHSNDACGSLRSTVETGRVMLMNDGDARWCLMSVSLFYVLFASSRDGTAVIRMGI